MVVAFAVAVVGCSPAPPSAPEVADEPVVAVLSFEVRGQTQGADYMGWAVAASLANRLAEAQDLQLIAPPVEPLAAEDLSSEAERRIAEGATRLVTGTLIREDGEVETLLQVRDATNQVLWETRASLDQGLSGLVRRLVTKGLGGTYPDLYEYIGQVTTGPEAAESSQAIRTMEAYRRNDRKEFLLASSQLVELYPEDAGAHVLNAWALTLAWDGDPSNESYLARLRDRLGALVEVDPASPYDEIMLAYVYRSSGQPEQARVLYSRVLDRNDISNSARAWALRQRSFTDLQVGNAAAATEDAAEAVRLDPSNSSGLVALSKALEAIDRLPGAVTRSEQALALHPSLWRLHQRLGLVLARAGNLDAAVQSMERACRLGKGQEPCANLAVTLQRAGRGAEAHDAAKFAESLAGTRWGHYNLGCFRALSGSRSAALEDLRRSVELGFADVLIQTDPDLESLRGDPDFESILAEIEDRLRSRQQLSGSIFPWQA
jgi:tetratricopeptide (TPR) repeat protein